MTKLTESLLNPLPEPTPEERQMLEQWVEPGMDIDQVWGDYQWALTSEGEGPPPTGLAEYLQYQAG